MRNPQYIRSSIGRKIEYRISTTIEKFGNGLRVIKRPAVPEAKNFLETFSVKNAALSEALSETDKYRVLELETDNGAVWTSCLPGKTLDEEFATATMQRDGQKITSLVEEAISCIDQLKTSHGLIDERALEIFGDFSLNGEETELLDCGYIDFNLDNFIRGGDKYIYLVDPEFKYDFGIPKQYVLNRLLLSYMRRYSHLFTTVANNDFCLYEIAEGFFVPVLLFEKFEDRFTLLQESMIAEDNFQNFYNYSVSKSPKILPQKDWQIYKRPLFKDGHQQIKSLHEETKHQQHEIESIKNELVSTSEKLDATSYQLNRYRNLLPFKLYRRIKQLLS